MVLTFIVSGFVVGLLVGVLRRLIT